MMSDKSKIEKQSLDLVWRDYKFPLLFLIMLALLGLRFPLSYVIVPIILINRFINDRYDFVIMLTILIGGYGFTVFETFYVNLYYVAFVFAFVVGVFLYKKPRYVKKIVLAWGVYAFCLLLFAFMSEERLIIQTRRLMSYITLIYFLIPMMAFAGKEFDILVFFRKVMPYMVIICAFYILDGFIVNGFVFVPLTFNWAEDETVFYAPAVYGFGSFPRKYPPGLYLLTLAVFPVVKYYKLHIWQWGLLIGAFMACRTFTVITGFVVVYILLHGYGKRLFIILTGSIALFIGLYFVDKNLQHAENGDSRLRIESSINQLLSITTYEDDDDLSKLGSGRLGQAIPKLQLLYALNREWIGFGFLDEERTTMQKYIIYNPYYIDPDKRVEVATGVEITLVQQLLYIGYLGLMLVISFYGYICYIVRKMPYSKYFYSVIFCFIWFGIAGFQGLVYNPGLMLISLSLSTILLHYKCHNNKNEETTYYTGIIR